MIVRPALIASLFFCAFSPEAFAEVESKPLDLTDRWVGVAGVATFFTAYIFAMFEDATMLRKSKPMVFAASLIWVFIAAIYASNGMGEISGQVFRQSLEAYAELFLFILVSMTYLNAMEQRDVFESLRIWLLSKGFGYRRLFWITGVQSFLLSSVCNNLTTALLMGTVIVALGRDNKRFISTACVNVVVATNAGGSFSPFGDITTLLVWQKGVVPFTDFFSLLLPSIVNFVLPASIMHFWIPKEVPEPAAKLARIRPGAKGIIVLFFCTIITAVCFEHFLMLPPAAGMMTGLSYLSFYFFYLYKVRGRRHNRRVRNSAMIMADSADMPPELMEKRQLFDVFHNVSRLEWDTLLFFYGVMLAVGGLSFMGYLGLASQLLYTDLDPTTANILVGLVSAFIDNGTIMYAVLTMQPDISQGQWLLVTLTAGVGGSLLAIGSAAGVGLLGQTKGAYSFLSHIKWMPVILLGYAGSIAAHFLINQRYF